MIAETERQERQRLRRKAPELSAMLREVARREELAEEELRKVRRRRGISGEIKVFCQLALKKYGHTGASVARCLGGRLGW